MIGIEQRDSVSKLASRIKAPAGAGWSQLTKTDVVTLYCARELRQRHNAGIGPRGASQHRHFAKLERLGLLRCVGWGRDIDAESIEGRDLLVYELTDTATSLLTYQDERLSRKVAR